MKNCANGHRNGTFRKLYRRNTTKPGTISSSCEVATEGAKTNDPEGDHILTFEQRLIELEREWMSKPTAELPPGSDLGSTELDGSFNVGSGILIQSMNLSSKDVWDSKGAIIRL